MKTIAEIHVENLDTLASPFGSQRQFAIHLNKDPKQVNQWWGKGSARGIGPQVAREIEERFGKPRGWLDNDHSWFSQLERLDGATIHAAIERMQQANAAVTGWRIDFSDPEDLEILAQAIRSVIADRIAEEDDHGSNEGSRQIGRIDRAAGQAKAGAESKPAPRRARKSA